jgi:hypothetical protein
MRSAENVTAYEYKNLKPKPIAFLVTVNVVVSNFHICAPHSLKISVKTDSRQFERFNMFH